MAKGPSIKYVRVRNEGAGGKKIGQFCGETILKMRTKREGV